MRPIDPYPAPGLAPKTGRPGRKLSPGPMGIVKPVDRATPKLLKALATNEPLNVEIDFYELDPQGTAEQVFFYRLVLTNAIVVEIHSAQDAQSRRGRRSCSLGSGSSRSTS